MIEKLIAMLVFVVFSWVTHKESEDSPPPREDDLFLRFRFNFMSYVAGFCAFCLLISILVDFFLDI